MDVTRAMAFSFVCLQKSNYRWENVMYATFWSLVPPLVAIILALITKEVYSSLFIGICLLYTSDAADD